MSEVLRNYTRALYGMDAVVQRVPADQWSADSPCEGWSARDVVAHASGVLAAVAQMAETGEVAWPQMPEVDDDILDLWNTSRDNVLAAIDSPGALNKKGEYWFGEGTIEDILGFSQWDTLVHAWDVAQATGAEAPPDQELAESSLATIGPMADAIRGMGLMADAVEVPPHSDAMTRFLGLTGRNPLG